MNTGSFATRRYRAIWISDVHLGSRDCKSEFLLSFLSSVECEKLFLVGDIFDIWAMRKSVYWPQDHSDVVRKILDMMRRGTRVIYIPGNHDDSFREYSGTVFGNLSIRREYIHNTIGGKRLLLLHGDEFDAVIKCGRLVSFIGNRGYDLLMWLNRRVYQLRSMMGFSYWSLSSFLKVRVRNARKHIENFERAAAWEARRRSTDGVVCGHIHRAHIGKYHGVEYFNCGDWVESCTALVEHQDGKLELIHWSDRQKSLKMRSFLEPVVPADTSTGKVA